MITLIAAYAPVLKPEPLDLNQIEASSIITFCLSFIAVLCLMLIFLWFGWWVVNRKGSLSPYSKKPMKLGTEIAVSEIIEIEKFLESFDDPLINPVFDIRRATVCTVTGRIFPNTVTIFGIPKVSWNFIAKRYPGNYVSWGSLSYEFKESLISCHKSLEGFQYQESSLKTYPKDIDEYHALLKPGPLYVDPLKKHLVGWKIVPGTEFEVLVVQLPIKS